MSEKRACIKLLLANDHTLFREGVVQILTAEDDMSVIAEAETPSDAIALAGREKPDVVVLDVEMSSLGAEKTIRSICHASPSSRVVILTTYDEPHFIRKYLELGVNAYIVKDATRDEFLAAIRAVYQAKHRVFLSVSRSTADALARHRRGVLSERELEILLLTMKGMSNIQIASRLYISEGTVKRHLTNVFAKLGASSRADAASKAVTSGLIVFSDFFESD